MFRDIGPDATLWFVEPDSTYALACQIDGEQAGIKPAALPGVACSASFLEVLDEW